MSKNKVVKYYCGMNGIGQFITLITGIVAILGETGIFIGFLLKSRERTVIAEAKADKLEEKFEELEKKIRQKELSNKEKFRDYFDFKNTITTQIVEVKINTENIAAMLTEMKEKISK